MNYSTPTQDLGEIYNKVLVPRKARNARGADSRPTRVMSETGKTRVNGSTVKLCEDLDMFRVMCSLPPCYSGIGPTSGRGRQIQGLAQCGEGK